MPARSVAFRAKNSRLQSFLFVREFSNERTRVERRAAYQKAKRKRLFTTAFSAYLKWITQAGLDTIDLFLSNRALAVFARSRGEPTVTVDKPEQLSDTPRASQVVVVANMSPDRYLLSYRVCRFTLICQRNGRAIISCRIPHPTYMLE